MEFSSSETCNPQPIFQFFMLPQQPDSLVILKNIQAMFPLLIDYPIYILIDPQNRCNLFQKQTSMSFLYFSQVDQAQKHIIKELKNKTVCVVAPLNMAREVNKPICHITNVSFVYYHTLGTEVDDFFQMFRQVKLDKGLDKEEKVTSKIKFLGTQLSIIVEEMNNENAQNKLVKVKKTLPNMISLNDQGWDCSILLRTMIAMIKQKNTQKQEIMKRFQQLYHRVYTNILLFPQGQQAIEKNMNKEQPEAIIKLYTVENSPFNRIPNNLMRVSKSPSELFYCQPYFKSLFNTISNLYFTKKSPEKYEELVYYRGASASEEQISFYKNNNGKIILNLGFLSTSRNEKIAEEFAKNLLFVIKVKKIERHQSLDFGYADISQYSFFPNEEETLFNPLNSFMIQKYGHKFIKRVNKANNSLKEKSQKVGVVYLRYGSLAEIKSKRQRNLKMFEKEQMYVGQADYFLEQVVNRIKNQGDAFISYKDSQEGGIEYHLEKLKHTIVEEQEAKSLQKLGAAYSFKGQYSMAEDYFQKCLSLKEKVFGRKHLEFVVCLNSFAILVDKMGRYEEALKYYQDCLNLQQQISGKNTSNYLNILNNLALVLGNLGRHEEALIYQKQFLDAQQRILGKTHPDFSILLHNFGHTLCRMGKYEEALYYYRNSIHIQERTLGKKNSIYANTLKNTADVLDRLGKYEEAIKYHKTSLAIKKKVLGENHPNFAGSLDNIGIVLSKMGNYKEAMEYHQQSLNIRQKILGKDHPDFAISLNNIGNLFKKMGQYDEAIKILQQCMTIREKIFGNDHLNFAVCLINIANVLDSMGKYQQGLNYLKKGLIIQQKCLGTNHPDFATSLNNIGSLLSSMGKYDEALKYHQQCKDIRQKCLGTSHPDFATSLNNIGSLLSSMGKYDEALKYHQQCKDIQQKCLGTSHPDFAISLSNIGKMFQNMGQYKEALEFIEKALPIYSQVFGKNHSKFKVCQAYKIFLISKIQSSLDSQNQPQPKEIIPSKNSIDGQQNAQ